MAVKTQDKRLDVRLRDEHKRLIEQAACIMGQSVSSFTVSTLVREAATVVERHGALVLSNRDRDIFLAALDNPPEPSERLRRYSREHDKRVRH